MRNAYIYNIYIQLYYIFVNSQFWIRFHKPWISLSCLASVSFSVCICECRMTGNIVTKMYDLFLHIRKWLALQFTVCFLLSKRWQVYNFDVKLICKYCENIGNISVSVSACDRHWVWCTVGRPRVSNHGHLDHDNA